MGSAKLHRAGRAPRSGIFDRQDFQDVLFRFEFLSELQNTQSLREGGWYINPYTQR